MMARAMSTEIGAIRRVGGNGMSMIGNRARLAWRLATVLAIVIGLMIPSFSFRGSAAAQATLPDIAAVAPESTVFFEAIDLNTEGRQWQQADELLGRAGLPNALDLVRSQLLSESAGTGGFTAADLDALLGGQMAFIVEPSAVKRLISMHMAQHGMTATATESMAATPEVGVGGEAVGLAAVLKPGDPDAAWAYAQRQVNAYADQLGVEVQSSNEGQTELIWTEGKSTGDNNASASDDPYDEFFAHQGKGAFAAGRDGDYIIAAMTPADVTSISDVIDGKTPSLADSDAAKDVASRLPAEALSFVYIDLESVFKSIDPQVLDALQSFMPAGAPREAWGGHVGFAVSADQPGFRFDSIATFPQGVDLSKILVENNPAVAAEAEKAPEGTFLFEAGVLPPNALTGLAYTFSQAINGTMAKDHMGKGPMAMLPTPEEIKTEVSQAAQTLGFNPASDLFDLLGGNFIAFVSFPQFGAQGMGLNGVAAIDTTDATKLSETMGKAADWIGKNVPDAKVTQRTIGGDTVYVLGSPEMQSAPAIEFGVVGGRAVVGIGKGIDELQSAPTSSLADSEQFQTVMKTLPSENYQIAYLDLGQVISMAMMMSGAYGAEAASPVAAQGSPANIKAFGLVGYRQDDAAGESAILYIAQPGS
jgi:hypothetical protein